MNQIVERLFVGDALGAKSRELLMKNKITHILNVSDWTGQAFAGIEYKVVPVQDTEQANIKVHFRECNDFILNALSSGGSVLVHCYAGLSRSVTIATAYLM